MYPIANLHRIIPDCICSYEGSMVENLRMQFHFEIRSNLIPDSDSSCLESWRIRLYRILHLSELCGALTPQNPSISRDRRKLRVKSWEWLEVVLVSKLRGR